MQRNDVNLQRNDVNWDVIFVEEKFKNYLITNFRKELINLLSGDYTTIIHLEQLRGEGIELFSLRTAQDGRQRHRSDRLLTLEHPDNPRAMVFVRTVENHNYPSRKKLLNIQNRAKDKLTQKTYVSINLESFLKEEIIANAPPNSNTNIFIGRESILLTNPQESAIHAELPLMVGGIPGAGKSYVLLSLMIQMIKKQTDKKGSILYVTPKNELLVSNMQKKMESNPAMKRTDKTVLFFSYSQLVDYLDPTNIGKVRVDSEHFKTWLEDNKKKFNDDAEWEVVSQNVDTLYQELRLISGYTEKEHDDLGRMQCTFLEKKQKELVRKIKKSYLLHLSTDTVIENGETKPVINLDFYKPSEEVLKSIKPFLFVAPDETQGFSTQQLEVLYLISDNGQVCYAIDTNQAWKDNKIFQRIYLKEHFKCSYKNLSYSHRFSKAAGIWADLTIKIKNKLTGGLADKFEEQEVKTKENAPLGHAELLITEKEINHYIAEYKQDPNTIIITTEEKRRGR